jgi:hypothetical protein
MKTSSGPESVQKHLIRFAIAATLAVSWFALVRPAEAEIIYTPTKITIGPNSSYNLDVNNDGISDFTISASVQFGGVCGGEDGVIKYYTTSVDETPASGNAVMGSHPTALSSGDQIGPSQTYYGGTGTLRSYHKNPSKCQPSATGNWVTHSIHYLGLTLQINGETFYGWAKLKVDVSPFTASATLLGYAYENIPGMPINAGQTNDSSSSLVPGPVNPDSSDLFASVTNDAVLETASPRSRLACSAEAISVIDKSS